MMFLFFDPRRARRGVPCGTLIAVLAALAMAPVAVAQTAQPPAKAAADTSSPTFSSKIGAQVNELKKIDVKQGDGAEALAGKAVIVHYTGFNDRDADGHGTNSRPRSQGALRPPGAAA
jgi:hypothetical protein